MHFSIPDTQELNDQKNGAFTAFNIHVNGVFHCTVRYKQLFNFSEQLKKAYGANVLPPFPPKKIFSLSSTELDERRLMLEKYMQLVSQDYKILNSSLFSNFFLSAQHETQQETAEEANIDVYLVNGHKISVRTLSTEQTDSVLEATCAAIELPAQFVYYFGLYLVCKDEDGESSIVRKLQDFESPVLSLRATAKNGASQPHKLLLRKSYWDSSLDDDLLDDRIAMNLLYVQAVNEVERGWTVGSKEQLVQLATLQKRGSKKEYLKLARTLKYYGYVHFKPCISDYPEPGSTVLVAAGGKELNFRIQVTPSGVKEGTFKITRVRCWRILCSHASTQSDVANGDASSKPKMELLLEYLFTKDSLKWISLQMEQAILLSMCMQGMVDELMMRKEGRRMRRPQDRSKEGPTAAYLKRDGTVVSGASGDVSFANGSGSSVSPAAASKGSVKKLTVNDKVSSLSIMGRPRKSSPSASLSSVGNEEGNSSKSGTAFRGIGDDDL